MKEKKQGKKQFTKNEVLERYKSILDHIEDGYCELDLAGNIILFNDSLRRILGYSVEELTGMNYRQYISPENVQRVYEFFHELYLTGTPGKLIDYEVITKDGSRRAVEASVSVIRDASGVPIRFRSLSRDVTERKRSEEELRKSEEKYRTILDAIEEGYFEVDLTGNFTFVNNHLQKIADATREELLGMNYLQYTNPETAKEMYHVFNTIYRTGEPVKIRNFEIIRMNGTKRICELSVALMRDAKGKPIGFRGINRDVTDREQAESSLRENEEKYRLSFENASDVICTIDRDMKITSISPSVKKILDYEPKEFVERSIEALTNIIAPESMDAALSYALKVLNGEDIRGAIIIFIARDRTKKIGEVSASPIIRGSMIVGAIVIARDITDRKLAEDALGDSLKNLRRALGATIQAMAMAVETRDPYTAGHQRRVADLARSIATEMGLPREQIDGLRMASTIHDIGKISIPAEILSKPSKLTDLEFKLIKTHAQSGYDMLKDVEFPWPIARVVLEHHERMNGTGYPNGLKGEQILLESRILMVADVVEAMGSHRPYRPAKGIESALEEISKNRATLYDPSVVDTCLSLFNEKGYKLVS